MKIENGEVISEIWPQNNMANYGNAMAETGRYAHLVMWASRIYLAPIDLLGFRDSHSYVESNSPYCSSTWFVSSDQCIPWYLAVRRSSLWLGPEMEQRIKDSGYETDDGNLITPTFFALLTQSNILLNICIFIQALLFKLPYRWDDGQKKFISTKNATADYLNWFHCALYCTKWVRNCVSKDTLMSKITQYYLPTDGGRQEPDVEWLLDLYKEVINNYY